MRSQRRGNPVAIQLPDSRQLSDEVLEALRIRALHGIELGFSAVAVAGILGLSRETVSRWWSAYASGGLETLPGQRTGRPIGAGRTLSEEQSAHLKRLIDTHSPEELGLPDPLWSRRAVRELIQQQYGISTPMRTVGEYFRRWGYTIEKLGRHARKQAPAEMCQWLEEVLPTIETRAKAEGAELHWCYPNWTAEGAHSATGNICPGQKPTVTASDNHARVNMISATSNQGTLRFMNYKTPLSGAILCGFLERLLRNSARKAFVIMNDLPAHEKEILTQWTADRSDRVEVFFFLSRCWPEFNPDEYLDERGLGRR